MLPNRGMITSGWLRGFFQLLIQFLIISQITELGAFVLIVAGAQWEIETRNPALRIAEWISTTGGVTQ